MLSNLDPSAELFLTDVGRIQNQIAESSRQVSSGKRIATPGDAPDDIAPLLQLRADRSHNTRLQSNLGQALSDANAADTALTTAAKLMDRAQTLAAQAANSVLDPSVRRSIAGEVQSIQDEMVGLSNTKSAGRYIFSGDADASPAYQLDLTAVNGVVMVSGAAVTHAIEDPAGGTFAASKTAQEIFDHRNADGSAAADNVFAALNSLRLAILDSPDADSSAVGAALSGIKEASAWLGAEQSFYGGVQNRIQSAQSYATNKDTQLRTRVSQIEDADVAAAALQLTQSNTQLSAAFQARARMPTKTLFDYLG